MSEAMRDTEHPPARVYRLAQMVINEVKSTPELDAVIDMLKPVLAVRKAEDAMKAAHAKRQKLDARYKPEAK